MFINKKNKAESVSIKEVSFESSLEKTTRDRLMDEATKIKSDIIDRDVKLNLTRVEKMNKDEQFEKRTLRELESRFQNKALRILVGRDRFFYKTSISEDQQGNLYSATRTAFDSVNPKESHYYAEGIVKGINAVYERVSTVYKEAHKNNNNVLIGTDDFLDAAYEIDLLEFYDKKINLTQVKTSSMDIENINTIHERHREYFNQAHKHSLDYMHNLVDTYTKNIHKKTNENPALYNHMESIHDFLKWVKVYYDEKYEQGKTEITDAFLDECAELHDDIDQFNFGYADMSLVFQKGDILHNIFMMGKGKYQELFNKINNAREKLPKKDLLKIRNDGITSILYNRKFFDKIIETGVLDSDEEFELERYMDMMRALDVWSVDRNENMNNHEMRVTYKKYEQLMGINPNRFIENAEHVHSVVVHGSKVHSIKLSDK